MLAAFTLRTPFAGFGKAVATSESALANGEATPSTLVGRAITWIKTSFITPVVEPVAIAPVLVSRVLVARLPTPTLVSLSTNRSNSAPVKVEPLLFNPRAGPYRSPIRTKLNSVLNKHVVAIEYPYLHLRTPWYEIHWEQYGCLMPSGVGSERSSCLDFNGPETW